MKTRLISIAILLLVLTVLITRNDERINDTLLSIINPLKQNYTAFTQNLKNKGKSYIFQQESIEKLSHENRILRKRLLEQTHYIQQVKNIYTVLPKLSKQPIKNISITNTISYVKLNSFSQIILTKPLGLQKEKLYGLLQNKVVAGIAQIRNNQLYGFLTSDEQCRFSVFIGEKNAPGIAIGSHSNTMKITFIPKWHKVEVGDKVKTSGLDNTFFANIPVGVVTKIEAHSSYKIAYIRTYSDVYHPKTFFLINDTNVTLTENFDSNTTYLAPFKILEVENIRESEEENLSNTKEVEENSTTPLITSIPSRIDQTQEETIDPIIPTEQLSIAKPKKSKKKKKHKNKKKQSQQKKKKKSKPSTSLDFF
ncbi:MAG: rod shape-determining protein MreC [Sulfurovum sp.]|nr:rod shape-determining protein MreC [Sulfurovum sp.]